MSDLNHLDTSPNGSPLSRRETDALEQLNEELRSAAPTELDWDAIETALMQRTELEAAARRRRRPHSSWGALSGFAAVAAAVVLMISTSSERDVVPTAETPRIFADVTTLPTYPEEPDALPRYRVGGMQAQSVIESGDEPVQMGLEGVAQWTLAPHSRVVVRSVGVPHVVELERGAIHAEVIPRTDSDSIVEVFSVEVDGTRVAVHGTVFTVERRDDMVDVEVTRGTVTVGPASYRGATTGVLMPGPSRAMFDAATGIFVKKLPMDGDHAPVAAHVAPHGERDVRRAPPKPQTDEPADDPKTNGDAMPPQQPNAPSGGPASSSEPAAEDPPEVSKLSSGQAGGLISSCLRANAKDKGFVISSNVTVHLGSDGEVMSMQFAPPLNPKFQSACGAALFGKRIEGNGSVSFGVSSK